MSNFQNSTDASEWAKAFCQKYPEGSNVPDEGTMIAWFANAMMAMHDFGPTRKPTYSEAFEIASRCWCTPETEKINIIPELAKAFANVLAFGEEK